MLRREETEMFFKQKQPRAEMRQSLDPINISDAAVSVCEMRAIKSEDSDPVRSPQLRRSSRTGAAASLFIGRPLPPPPARPITAGLPRPLSGSFDAALLGSDVSIDTEEPGTEP